VSSFSSPAPCACDRSVSSPPASSPPSALASFGFSSSDPPASALGVCTAELAPDPGIDPNGNPAVSFLGGLVPNEKPTDPPPGRGVATPFGEPAPNANGVPGVESGVENENGLVDGATDDPAVAVVESAGEGAAMLLGVPKLNGFASGLGVKPPKGFAVGVADPNPNVGLGVSAGALVFAAARSKMFEARPSGMGDGVGVASGMTPAPNELNVALGFRGDGGTAAGVAAGVSSGRLEPKVGLVDGRLSPNGEGFGADTEGAGGLADAKEKGEGCAASFVVEVEEPKPKVGLDSVVGGAGLGASGTEVMGFETGAETFAFFASSKSLTTFCR
jgi:hypothetical protein